MIASGGAMAAMDTSRPNYRRKSGLVVPRVIHERKTNRRLFGCSARV
jgi:hypothetical protein